MYGPTLRVPEIYPSFHGNVINPQRPLHKVTLNSWRRRPYSNLNIISKSHGLRLQTHTLGDLEERRNFPVSLLTDSLIYTIECGILSIGLLTEVISTNQTARD